MIVFLHQSNPDDPTSDWNQFEIMKLGNKKPCTCMQLVPDERNELWVGCGNTIRIIDISEMKLEEEVIKVDQVNDVQGFSYQGESIWCFVKGSPIVVQYDAKSRKRVDSFDCGNVVMSKGEVLSMHDSVALDGVMEEEEEDSTTGDEKKDCSSATMGHLSEQDNNNLDGCGNSKSSNSMGRLDENAVLEQLNQQDPSVTSTPINQSSTLPSHARVRSLSDTFKHELEATRHSMYTAPNLPTIQPRAATAKIHSIEVVEDTLWVGRDLGDVVVISIGDNHGYRCGQVVAILSMSGMLASPVNHLMRVGEDRVVICQEIVGESGLFKHHVLVWRKWGTEEFNRFDNVHSAIEEASLQMR